MIKRLRNKILKLTALLLVVVMGMLVLNQSVNLHSHQLNDGSVITHAHPYQESSNNTPFKSHYHSLKAFIFLEHIGLLFVSLALVVLSLFVSFEEKRSISLYNIYARYDDKVILGRAPPVV